MLRVCEGTEDCLSFEAIALSDDSCSLCPETQFVCPASGVYSVLTGSFNSSLPSVCQPTTQAAGPFGLLDPCPVLGAQRDCGWSLSPEFSQLGCTPGQLTTFGCQGCGTGGSCLGDPMLRVCAGTEPCTLGFIQ